MGKHYFARCSTPCWASAADFGQDLHGSLALDDIDVHDAELIENGQVNAFAGCLHEGIEDVRCSTPNVQFFQDCSCQRYQTAPEAVAPIILVLPDHSYALELQKEPPEGRLWK